jgi:hypothetical protein
MKMPEPLQTEDQGPHHDILLAEYEFARENRHAGDAIAWEMTAIVWGGQTLLLGFALEAIQYPSAQPLIPLLAILGILLSIFNHVVIRSRRTVCNSMNQVCREIETMLPMKLQPQHRLDGVYTRGKQTTWFLIVNYIFVAVWLCVALRAVVLFCTAVGRNSDEIRDLL